MPTYPVGILPFGSDDDSVVFQNSLTSSAGITGETQATGTLVGTGHVFDSVLGCKPGVSGSIKFATIDSYTTLETACQLSFEVESDFIADDQTGVAGSEGFDHTTDDYLVS